MVFVRRKSTRLIKKPELYIPEDTVLEDDYSKEEHDSEIGSDIDTGDELYSDEESEDDDDGESLKDFIDDDESDEEDA
jgi:hypothetical protein